MQNSKKLLLTRLAVLFVIIVSGACILLGAFITRDGLIYSILRLTHATWDAPQIFGGFHVIMLSICLMLAILTFVFWKKVSCELLDKIVFFSGIILFALEIYKQAYYHTVLGNGYYNFGILPLQLCSYAMYLFLIIPLLPEGKVKDSLYKFCALYQTMGACIVMAYPVLYREISLSLHTMLWHTLMIAVGILILKVRGYGQNYLSDMIPATLVFLCTVSIATVLNFTLTPYATNSLLPLNLLYISPYEKSNYLIIGDVQRTLGWLPSVICYILLFVFAGATLVWLVAKITSTRQKNKSL